jgi:hypothetical protein
MDYGICFSLKFIPRSSNAKWTEFRLKIEKSPLNHFVIGPPI